MDQTVPDRQPHQRQTTLSDVLRERGEIQEGHAEGVVERIVFESPDSGFLVARLRVEGEPELTTFVGNMLAVSPGETIRLWGRWVDDKKFGRQLKVERYETVMPATVAGIEKYLGSGLIEGIGPTYAKRLVDAFGVETLRVIDEQPERLRAVDGIGEKRAAQIRESWSAQRAIQSIMIFLQGHGISVTQSAKIYKRYGDAAVSVLRENPYRLAEDIVGMAFKSADAIAENLGIAKDAPRRIEAGLLHVLQQATGEGHVFLPEAELLDRARQLLGVEATALEQALDALTLQGSIMREDSALFLPLLQQAEVGCDKLIKRLLGVPQDPIAIKMDKAIAWVEREQGFDLSEEQRDAIRTAVEAKVMVITGGPGTGKTTVLNGLLDIFEKKNVQPLLAAPTGRAAKRMEAATNRAARTIHRLLEFSPKDGGFTRNEGNPLSADLVVIDETSMVDVHLLNHLLKALPPQARLILVGDVDQLPSVGPGNVLLDVIASNVVPVITLQTVFRQAQESGIVTNAHLMNQGKYPEFNDLDFFFVERTDPARAVDTVLELVTERIPKKFGMDPVKDIQVLAPMHRGDVGVANLNTALQQRLNPDGRSIPRRTFKLNDKVMQMRNNYELDTYNGDVGVVTVADDEAQEAHVAFDDRVVLYTYDQLDELTLAYAGTVHKAQGSEYPAVVIPLLTQHYVMLQRNVLYTAITRAAKLCILVGDPKAVGRAVRNTDVTRRNTRLADRLRNTEELG
jgi:exodeoxyribonuclease V alpha subunit